MPRPHLPLPYLCLASATTRPRIGLGLGLDIASPRPRIGLASVGPRQASSSLRSRLCFASTSTLPRLNLVLPSPSLRHCLISASPSLPPSIRLQTLGFASCRHANRHTSPSLALHSIAMRCLPWPGLALPRLAITRPRLPPPYFGLASATNRLRIGLGLGLDIASPRLGLASDSPRSRLGQASTWLRSRL